MLGEDIQDELGAIQYAAFQAAFEIAVLRRRQVVIEQHEVAALFGRPSLDFTDLASA